MKVALLERLRCPRTYQRLRLESDSRGTDDVHEGWLINEDGQHRYPIRRGVPSFVPESNYADSFGMQWNHFARTQLDSHSGHSISADRFWAATGWTPSDIKGQWVLDAGCGAGRFAEIAVGAGANVVALDYSSAVHACYANLHHNPNLHVVQGDIYALPFQLESFPFVYSLGVLQHTPDVAAAVASLPPMLAAKGRLCIDFYEKSLKSQLLPKYWLRPMTKHVAKPTLFAALERIVPVLLPLSRALGRVPAVGFLLQRVVPVANYEGILPLTEAQLREWALLDTFDWLSPAYDQPQTAQTLREWLHLAALTNLEVVKAGHLVGRATKP